jgi:hypothetical protein
MVEYNDLKGKEYYSIKKVNGDFAGLSRCTHLSVNKIYQVVFEKQPIGLICTATVID